MLNLIQVKFQEHTSCRFKKTKLARLDRSRRQFDGSDYVSADFNFGPSTY